MTVLEGGFFVIFHLRKKLILKWNANFIFYQVMRNNQKVMWTVNYVSHHKYFRKWWFLQSTLCPSSFLWLGHVSSQDSQMSHPPLNLSLDIVLYVPSTNLAIVSRKSISYYLMTLLIFILLALYIFVLLLLFCLILFLSILCSPVLQRS